MSVFGEHETVDGNFTAADPLAVVLDLCPAVVRLDGMRMKIENHRIRLLAKHASLTGPKSECEPVYRSLRDA